MNRMLLIILLATLTSPKPTPEGENFLITDNAAPYDDDYSSSIGTFENDQFVVAWYYETDGDDWGVKAQAY
eukprot:CAMPEP_0201281168 /NCGR_PEP_ID=MMETSP1317-20130820/1783_1 /ASSEMBLY_ACC=CAM_ASM_000770 /TAXON_ID=187299 /ORGANISM="Undescribed Undescribed, Strain Undescribed" /LENGTH=70 /DNA_ID=CAMNT_0047590353 /DNA_START=34 /DNA_END=246 /DNA_ORIENTATION=+